MNAAVAGAVEVVAADASPLAVAQAEKNAALNGVSDKVHFVCRDVFDLLPELEEQGEKPAVVIDDPGLSIPEGAEYIATVRT